MSSAFDSLISGFTTLLSSSTPVCPYIDTDGDAEPLPAGRTQSILVTLGSAQAQLLGGLTGNPVDWLTEVHVKCFASAHSTSARPAANALANAAYTRLATDPSVGLGVGVYIGEPRIEWETDQNATRMALATLIYTVSHRTSGGSLN